MSSSQGQLVVSQSADSPTGSPIILQGQSIVSQGQFIVSQVSRSYQNQSIVSQSANRLTMSADRLTESTNCHIESDDRLSGQPIVSKRQPESGKKSISREASQTS